ncbi:unnamed protein product [Gadus morhua 'NCC']
MYATSSSHNGALSSARGRRPRRALRAAGTRSPTPPHQLKDEGRRGGRHSGTSHVEAGAATRRAAPNGSHDPSHMMTQYEKGRRRGRKLHWGASSQQPFPLGSQGGSVGPIPLSFLFLWDRDSDYRHWVTRAPLPRGPLHSHQHHRESRMMRTSWNNKALSGCGG